MAEEKKTEKKDRFKLAKEFKAFISRGNVLDMAVGLIIGCLLYTSPSPRD